MTIEVLAIGTQIVIDGEIPAHVAGICIEDAEGSISYKCVWWDERKRNVEWLPAGEIRPKDAAKHVRIQPR